MEAGPEGLVEEAGLEGPAVEAGPEGLVEAVEAGLESLVEEAGEIHLPKKGNS